MQLQKAVTTIFDLRVSDLAPVTYELGIALTLGKPVVVLVAEDQIMPFDVDVEPVVLTGGPEDDGMLAAAVDQSVVWTYPTLRGEVSLRTLDHAIAKYPRPQQNIYADQTLGMLAELRKAPDPLAITRTLVTLVDYLKDGTALVYPWWPPVYPEESRPRLFHVMPFRPKWADKVTAITRCACERVVEYVRGDEADEPNVIRSIWEEIARAAHVLVDLTGFNANVALELGIAHTLGKNVLMVGQGDTVDHLFPSIRKLRFHTYKPRSLKKSLEPAVMELVLAKESQAASGPGKSTGGP